MHPAFANAGKKQGIEIWRIENFEPVPYPVKDYGKFYTGDSYIVLVTTVSGGSYRWDIHFWLGSETSQDESGSAAVLAVQLDEQLGGVPIQYREVQDHESQLFLSHFKNGVRYLPGGVASGFHHVDSSFEKNLFQVKGKKNIRVKHVELSASSLNKGDCFILDVGSDIYVYIGAKSKRLERLKAISAANQIRDQDHGGRSKVQVIDEFSSQDEVSKFFEELGSGSPSEVAEDVAGGDDAEFERSEENVVTLYKVSDASGKMNIQQVAQKPLKQEMLDSNDCFILDTAKADIYVWIGKKCNGKEKREAMATAQKFLTSKNYPAWTRIQRIVEGGEPSTFNQYFSNWRGATPSPTRTSRRKGANIICAYHCKLLNNGKLTMNEIHDVVQEDLDVDDAIIIETNTTVYVWIGNDADEEERKWSTKKAKALKEFNDREEVVIVDQGQEPGMFIDLFPSWNPELWSSAPTYEERKKAVLHG